MITKLLILLLVVMAGCTTNNYGAEAQPAYHSESGQYFDPAGNRLMRGCFPSSDNSEICVNATPADCDWDLVDWSNETHTAAIINHDCSEFPELQYDKNGI